MSGPPSAGAVPNPTPTPAPAGPAASAAPASMPVPVPLIPPPFAPPAFMLPPVPPPWTEHRAPAGQPYWFNPITNVSTYVRPLPPQALPGAPAPGLAPMMINAPPLHFHSASTSTSTSSASVKKEKEKKEKPKTKLKIEGTEWIEVTTNKGNLFWSHRGTKESVWTMPKEVKEVNARKERQEREARQEREKEQEMSRKRKAEEGAAEEEEVVVVVAEEPEEKEESTKQEDGTTAPTTTTTNEVASAPTDASESAAPPKKKKKSKVVVVHDIEQMEQDEDWQRQIAEEMAREVEEQQRQQQQEQAQQQQTDHVGRSVGRPQAAAAPLGGLDVSAEEGMALFKAMLGEKEINPMAPWDMELPKFINDPRYTAVKQLKDRRDLFEEFCKEKLREIRAAKAKAAAEGSLPKTDPLTAYRVLLETAVASTRTHYSDFKRQHHKDPRFRNFGKTEGEKEKVFKQWLRELGEKKRADANKAEKAFKEMLSADTRIKSSDQWSEVKARFASDSRYGAVASASQREGLFEAHRKLLAQGSNGPTSSNGATASTSTSTSTTKPTLTKEERAARTAASLHEREEQVRAEKERTSRQARAAKGNLGREEGEREFGTLLVDQVRDHNARWEEVVPFLSKDPRFTDSSLSIHDQRRQFDLHIKALYDKRLAVVEDLFAQHAPTMTTRFERILPSIVDSPHVIRLVEKDYDRLEHLYEAWLRKWSDRARREFDELLKESAILEHWGRLAKHEDLDKVKVMGEEGAEDSEDEDEMPSIVEMAKQVDLPAIQKVLRHDKRYLVFDHVPQEREQWLKEYLGNLSAPKQTVHQKE